jgi:hypothetical protein
LAEKMTAELNSRKRVIAKAEKELEAVGLPRVYNPEHAETAIQFERLLRRLGAHMTGKAPPNERAQVGSVRSFIVHGHDHKSLFELKDYLQNTLGLD